MLAYMLYFECKGSTSIAEASLPYEYLIASPTIMPIMPPTMIPIPI